MEHKLPSPRVPFWKFKPRAKRYPKLFTHGIHQPHEPPDEELVELVERAINGMN